MSLFVSGCDYVPVCVDVLGCVFMRVFAFDVFVYLRLCNL